MLETQILISIIPISTTPKAMIISFLTYFILLIFSLYLHLSPFYTLKFIKKPYTGPILSTSSLIPVSLHLVIISNGKVTSRLEIFPYQSVNSFPSYNCIRLSHNLFVSVIAYEWKHIPHLFSHRSRTHRISWSHNYIFNIH